MLEKLNEAKGFEYIKLSEEEQKKRGILGRLEGVIADFKNPTRNGRLYSEELWDKTFENPIMKEKIKNRCLFGELGHPENRLEVDMEKIAICLAEEPKKGKDGKLYGIFDIINTPNGKILKALCDYGCNIGVSSRGTGDLISDFDGNESVDPDTYQCECWDAVIIPAVEAARLSLVTESLDTKSMQLKKALNEALESATPDDKRIMKETLDELNIEYNRESVIDKKEPNEAVNDVKATMVKDLQESLLAKEQAEAKVLELQEKLSVCYAKEAKYEEDIAKYKNAIRNLSESASNAKALQVKVESLTKELGEKETALNEEKVRCANVVKKHEAGIGRQNSLTESISIKEKQLADANQTIARLNEKLESLNNEFENGKRDLTEKLMDVKKNLTMKTTEFSNKLDKANKLVEQYRNTAKIAVGKYIDSQALRLGVSADEITNKLPRNYSFSDIDTVCENLNDYKINLSNLPFDFSREKKVVVKESHEPILPKNKDDVVDDSLLKLAGIK